MFLKFIAAAAIVGAPAVVHAQATTPTNPTTWSSTYPQDTTRSSSRIHTDSTKVDSASGSVTTENSSTTKRKDRIRDTTTAGKTPPSKVHVDSARLHSDSSMNVSPTDSTRMGTPNPSSTRTPPR